MKKWTYTHLEILHHHLTHGVVWDGDQISKAKRNELMDMGLLQRVDGTGHCALTVAGSRFIRRNALMFAAWSRIKHLPITCVGRDFLRSLMPAFVRA